MAYSLKYFDEVEEDIENAKFWYKTQQNGLEIKFTDAITQTIHQILEAPKQFVLRYKEIRIAHPKKFPYNIHFYIDEPNKTVVITAIIHSKRLPKIAQKRT